MSETRLEPLSPDPLEGAPGIFFIGGMPRSGTTWVQELIDAHPEAACFGEAGTFNELTPTLANVMRDYNKFCGPDNPEKTLPINGFTRGDMKHVIRFAFLALARANIDGPLEKYRVIGEKTPDTVENLIALNFIFPTARFIHVIRDGRDAALSGWLKFGHKIFPEGSSQESYVGEFARNWMDRIRTARSFRDQMGDRYYEIRYEDLVENGVSAMAGLCEFLHCSKDTKVLENCLQEASFEVLSRGRQAGVEDQASHFRKGVQGDWKEGLSSQSIKAFEEIAAPMLAELGYEI